MIQMANPDLCFSKCLSLELSIELFTPIFKHSPFVISYRASLYNFCYLRMIQFANNFLVLNVRNIFGGKNINIRYNYEER
jgi:hypothetical protein